MMWEQGWGQFQNWHLVTPIQILILVLELELSKLELIPNMSRTKQQIYLWYSIAHKTDIFHSMANYFIHNTNLSDIQNAIQKSHLFHGTAFFSHTCDECREF